MWVGSNKPVQTSDYQPDSYKIRAVSLRNHIEKLTSLWLRNVSNLCQKSLFCLHISPSPCLFARQRHIHLSLIAVKFLTNLITKSLCFDQLKHCWNQSGIWDEMQWNDLKACRMNPFAWLLDWKTPHWYGFPPPPPPPPPPRPHHHSSSSFHSHIYKSLHQPHPKSSHHQHHQHYIYNHLLHPLR